MSRFILNFVIPILIAVIAGVANVYGTWGKMPEPKSLQELFSDISVISVCVLVVIAIIQSAMTLREKIIESKKVSFDFRLRREAEPELDIDAKYKRVGSINGIFTIRVDRDGKKDLLLQRQISYDEVITGPSEIMYKENTVSNYSSVNSFRNSSVRLQFEPTNKSFWTRNLYNKDDLHENLFDAPLTANGERQLLIYSNTLESRVAELVMEFEEPDKVMKVNKAGGNATNEIALPVIFNLAHQTSFIVNREKLFDISIRNISLQHNFAIKAVLTKEGIVKSSLFYMAETIIDIDKTGTPSVVEFGVSQSVINAFCKSMLSSMKSKKSGGVEVAYNSLLKQIPKGRDV